MYTKIQMSNMYGAYLHKVLVTTITYLGDELKI